ncbi:aminotransferase class I/II-fold pyridoxal phosphate-dependent enzyme [Deinococcus yavapaiensis]|uniref:Aminotransferase n=1 Tax=Deinococcus yavapaiensis KR-236 TaxID=694435 RepID=A0A318RZ51_9DEIO|nr:aminotransferase class I/II-fold pyridoxal phosphate-dependent enzyme [Deinococcus yavapaiensis]PYE48400.1 hypothetical protein DES52_12919 [Deinococcus yavapaiensis KR-236]
MPESIFTVMDRAKSAARSNGLDVIDLSIGSSDLAPPIAVLDALREATRDPSTYRYPLHSDTADLRSAAALYMRRRFDVTLDAERYVLPLIGAQEGLAHLLLAVTDPGDTILLPDPAYPPYLGAATLAGLHVHRLPLTAENAFLPRLDVIREDALRRAKVLLLNYPNNPTSATATVTFFEEAVRFCRAHDLLLVHDHPYAETTFGDYRAPSALEVDRDALTTVELHSLSKSFSMGGFRVGFAVGHPDVLAALARVKGAVDFHQYLGIQRAAAVALNLPESFARETADVFEARRDALLPEVRRLGWTADIPRAGMYVWAKLPPNLPNSLDFASRLARETGVALAPGVAFGPSGEGYVRFALVRAPNDLLEAVRRIEAYCATPT